MRVPSQHKPPLNSDSRAATSRTFRIKSHQSIDDGQSCCETLCKSIGDTTLLQPRNVNRERIRAKLDNLRTRSRAMRLESMSLTKQSHARLSDLGSRTSMLDISNAVTPRQNKSKDLAAKFNNKPLDIFMKKKRKTSSVHGSFTEMKHLGEYISASKERKNPFEARISAIVKDVELSASQTEGPEKFKLNSFFKRRTSILSNGNSPTNKLNVPSINVEALESSQISHSQITVVKFGLKPVLIESIEDSKIGSCKEQEEPLIRPRSGSKNVNEYVREYTSIVNKSRASSLNRSLIPKMQARISININNTQSIRSKLDCSQISESEAYDINAHITRNRTTSEYVDDVTDIMQQSVKANELNQNTQACLFAKKVFRGSKIHRRISKPDTLPRNDSHAENKVQCINEVLTETGQVAEKPSLLAVHKSNAKLTQHINIGEVDEQAIVRTTTDDIGITYTISNMIWFTDGDIIKGFQMVYHRVCDNKRKYGTLHGCITSTPLQFKISANDQLSSIYFYTENGALKSLKFITTYDEVFLVGIPLEEVENIDGIQCIEISAKKCLTHISSYFCDDDGSLAKLQLILS